MSSFRRFSSMLILACLIVFTPSADISSQRLPVPASAELHARVAERGSISVIVELDIAYTPVSELSPQEAKRQRQSLNAFRRDLLSKLEGKGVSLQGRSDHWMIPFIALRVNRKGLRALESLPGIVQIVEDKPSNPSLLDVIRLTDTIDAHTLGFTGVDQVVAVIDTGVDRLSPMLSELVVGEVCYSETSSKDGLSSLCGNGANFQTGPGAATTNRCSDLTGCWHGTFMSGIVAGAPYTIDGKTYKGIAYGAKILAAQVYTRSTNPSFCDTRGVPCIVTFTSYQTDALQYIYDNRGKYNLAAVVLGYNGAILESVNGVCDNDIRRGIVDALYAVGIATIIPSGNDGNSKKVAAPACIANAITVGATDSSVNIANWSNSSSLVDLLAVGDYVTSAWDQNAGLASANGTSVAAAQVAGAWAILKQVRPNAEVNTILNALQSSGWSRLDPRNGLTHKFIQVSLAIRYLQPMPSAANLITNFDFESGSGSSADGWILKGTGVSRICGIGNPLVYAGSCAAQLVSNGKTALFKQTLVQTATDTNYAWLSARVNRHKAKGAIVVTFVRSDGKRLKLKMLVAGKGTYRLISNTMPLESGTYTITVKLTIDPVGGGSYEVDDLQLTFQEASAPVP